VSRGPQVDTDVQRCSRRTGNHRLDARTFGVHRTREAVENANRELERRSGRNETSRPRLPGDSQVDAPRGSQPTDATGEGQEDRLNEKYCRREQPKDELRRSRDVS